MVSLDDWHVRDKSKAHFCLIVLPPNDIIIIAKDSFFDSFISFLIESLGGPASYYWSNKQKKMLYIYIFFLNKPGLMLSQTPALQGFLGGQQNIII